MSHLSWSFWLDIKFALKNVSFQSWPSLCHEKSVILFHLLCPSPRLSSEAKHKPSWSIILLHLRLNLGNCFISTLPSEATMRHITNSYTRVSRISLSRTLTNVNWRISCFRMSQLIFCRVFTSRSVKAVQANYSKIMLIRASLAGLALNWLIFSEFLFFKKNSVLDLQAEDLCGQICFGFHHYLFFTSWKLNFPKIKLVCILWL